MKQDTLEGKAKTKNGVKRLCFSIICILLEVIFIITIVTQMCIRDRLGIPMATAIDMYLKQISLVGGIPFSIVLPKAAN